MVLDILLHSLNSDQIWYHISYPDSLEGMWCYTLGHKTQLDNLHSDLDWYGISGLGSLGGIVLYSFDHKTQVDNLHSDLHRYGTSGAGSLGGNVLYNLDHKGLGHNSDLFWYRMYFLRSWKDTEKDSFVPQTVNCYNLFRKKTPRTNDSI